MEFWTGSGDFLSERTYVTACRLPYHIIEFGMLISVVHYCRSQIELKRSHLTFIGDIANSAFSYLLLFVSKDKYRFSSVFILANRLNCRGKEQESSRYHWRDFRMTWYWIVTAPCTSFAHKKKNVDEMLNKFHIWILFYQWFADTVRTRSTLQRKINGS